MSDAVNELNAHLEREAELSKRKKELSEKRLVLDERRVNFEHSRLLEMDRSTEVVKNSDFGALSMEEAQELVRESNEYMRAARNSMQFMTPDFDTIVPFFRKNLILIGGATGDGKSTCVCNIAMNIIRQRNPDTGDLRKVLIITNEEKREDVYNRITCGLRGWAYTNHNKFTDHQIQIMNESLVYMATKGIVVVVDDFWKGSSGTTTTIEGIRNLFSKLMETDTKYDAILIDYYQNVNSSSTNPRLTEFEVQDLFKSELDKFKNIYPAPIVVLAQCKPPDEERKEPFEFRIKGRKSICVPSTYIMEIASDKKFSRTEWIIHKTRFTEAIGKSIWTGFDRGKFVAYTQEFENEIQRKIEALEMQKINSTIGIKEVNNK